MAASKSPRVRLLHIRDEINGVAGIVQGLSFEQYLHGYVHRRAIERAVQIISEAAKALPGELLDRYPDAPWRSIIGIGNILRHDTNDWTINSFGKLRPSIFPIWGRSCVR